VNRRHSSGRAGVEQDRAGVVVAVRAQRFAESGVVRGVLLATGQPGCRVGRPGHVGGVGIAAVGRLSHGGHGRGRTTVR